jgi:hypothetical protein
MPVASRIHLWERCPYPHIPTLDAWPLQKLDDCVEGVQGVHEPQYCTGLRLFFIYKVLLSLHS